MSLVPNVLLLLCLAATLNQVQPSVLSREINVPQSPRPAFEDILAQIRNTDIRLEAVKLVFKHSDETFSSLTNLVSAKSDPELYEILDIFNTNFGVRLLVVNEENVQLDPAAYQRFLSNQARSIVKNIFPKNVGQQMLLYGVLQKQIQRTCQDIQPAIESRKVPVEQINALITTKGLEVSLRAGILTSLVTAVETSVCNTVISFAYEQLNSTLTSVVAYLDTVSVGSGNSIVVALVTFVIDYVENIIEGFNELAESLSSSMCSTLVSALNGSSRKRRDADDTALVADLGSRDVLTRGIFSSITDVVWWLISGVLNTTLKNLWDSMVTTIEEYLDEFIEGTLTTYVYSLINSIFS